ncbi:MAG: ABC transporter permease, partial [Rhizobiales bacterium]|nr:ABC transporter permease [Hyphomicrobiales bacterium]
MTFLLARRLLGLVVTLAAASIIIFLIMEVLPGDPAAVILGVGAEEATLAALRAELGLDRPPAERYLAWIADLARGDLGQSHTYAVPVAELISERLTVTFPLALIAMVLTTVIAVPAGVVAARLRGRAGDIGISVLAQIGIAIPNFWFAMLLIMALAVGLGWLPAGGFPGWDAGALSALQALVLPAIALALPQAAILTRVTRSSMLDTIGEDYVRTARAKGLTRNAALW